jgi:hypothetical protein
MDGEITAKMMAGPRSQNTKNVYNASSRQLQKLFYLALCPVEVAEKI